MKMYVTMKIEGYFTTGVEADNPKEAIKKAIDNFYEADFGQLADIEGDAVKVEDEVGNFLYER